MKAGVTLEHPRFGLRLTGDESHVEVRERHEVDHGGSGPASRRFVGETLCRLLKNVQRYAGGPRTLVGKLTANPKEIADETHRPVL